MNRDKDVDPDTVSMIADYMENGFLENIIDMFRQNREFYSHIGELIQDKRVRVRIGITALIEELKNTDRDNVARALPNILPLLRHKEAVVRGDAASLLGIIGDTSAIPALSEAVSDEHPDVRMLATEALEEIQSGTLE
jgi:HEAT repeat protein